MYLSIYALPVHCRPCRLPLLSASLVQALSPLRWRQRRFSGASREVPSHSVVC